MVKLSRVWIICILIHDDWNGLFSGLPADFTGGD
ncbi:hypothetical protein TFLX_04024 [Thermoflexales bacterium]|nr:hypothetical protein TFLX_04024 [Thermoflexales bacterium]